MDETQEQPIIQIVVSEIGDPDIATNMPIHFAIAFLELAKQKLFAQFYGAVNQERAKQAALKPDIVAARIVPPDLKKR